ncbi:MAG: PD-(D/E)XK motif protein [Erysipelotrichaceae bacterium]|nr:PD-(D/E)XK motif protein [Erysipelotrichaceae bacterium]
MNKSELIEKFNQVKENSYYIAVSKDHPLDLYVGKNEKGYLTLRFNGDFIPIKIKSNELLAVKQIKLKNHNSILFSYDPDEDPSIFYSFCEDIINGTNKCQQENGYTELVNRYNKWKKLFYSSSNILTELEIMGMIGELLFLKDFVFSKFGKSNGLSGWSGPEPTHKDFSFGNEWYETKTINSFKNSVTISSLEQLDSDYDGKLVVYKLQKMSPSFDGITLNRLVNEILDSLSLDNDKDLFVSKLQQVGYVYNEHYDDFVYEVSSMDKYIVNKDFPKIKKESIMEGIGSIKYEILLGYIETFKE